MGYAILLVYLALTFVRPAELFPGLAGYQLMDVASLALLMGTALTVLAGRGPTLRAPQLGLCLLFVLWATFSVVASRRWLGGAFQVFVGLFSAAALGFFVVALNTTSPRRLRGVAAALSTVGLYLAVQGILAFHLGVGGERLLLYQGLDPQMARDLSADQRAEVITQGIEAGAISVRIRSVGFLNDPNDLAQALVATLPFLLAFRSPRGRLGNALRVWLPAALIVYAVALTRSRGGVLALVTVVFLLLRHRLNRVVALGLSGAALGGLILVGFAGGRSFEMDESAQGRTEAWYAGIQMLKSSPIWGVGAGMFTDHHELVAHNSFVHCFAELGLVGYFLWLALLVLTLADLVVVARHPTLGTEHDSGEDPEAAEIVRWGRAALHSLAGFLVGALLLSRTYSPLLFLLLGVGVAAADQARRRGWLDGSPSAVQWTLRIIALEAVSIVLVSFAVRGLG